MRSPHFHDQTRPTRLDVETIRHAILSYGFTPTWLAFTVQADLTAHEGKAALRVPDTGQLTWLVERTRGLTPYERSWQGELQEPSLRH